MDSFSYISNADPVAIEHLYMQYRNDPDSVEFGWRKFFEGFEFSNLQFLDEDSPEAQQAQAEPSRMAVAAGMEAPVPVGANEMFIKEINVINLIGAYRQRGHLYSKTNPIRKRRKHAEPITLTDFGLEESDLEQVFQAGLRIGLQNAKLAEIIEHLEQTYCHSIGVEYVYMRPLDARKWLQQQMESCRNLPRFTRREKRYILHKLNQASVFENFLHTKYVGQKRFSLEGAEAIIPALDAIVENGADLGIEEFVIGMAHRGRLNVLANILGKSYDAIFSEFEGRAHQSAIFAGDVKYHLGFSSDRITSHGKKVHLSLCPNPSHLEAVNPVVQGNVRAKIDRNYKGDFKKVAPILIHGDAAIAGQGINYEVIQMSRLEGFATGGTIHVVLNNQVGFTTNYMDARSSTYCTDFAKTTLSPIFHVNGDDVEAVCYCIQMALEYRQQFHRDVFVDIVCYRKYGHNEGDEPRFTQPILYDIIKNHPNPREIYAQRLIHSGEFEPQEINEMQQEFKLMLDEKLKEAQAETKTQEFDFLEGNWQMMRISVKEDFDQSPITGVQEPDLADLAKSITHVPEDLKSRFFPKIKKLLEERRKSVFDSRSIDWALAEHLAFATLLKDRYSIRMSGQDVERGTFSQRHAVIKMMDTEMEYIPLQNLYEGQPRFEIYNSLLSEYGVLGFEYGYALSDPNQLVVWEAQFGDFANGAQIIIDQFICCGETKWQRMNGLVLLLPHGYEGQGPEHSSARIERYLTLCGDLNMTVSNPSTPANYFHLLRRQLFRPFRKPLVVITPKSLLRHPLCVSPLEHFLEESRFQEVIDDHEVDPQEVTRVVLCSGKVYYDLYKHRKETQNNNIALVRLEQYYPFPERQLKACLSRYAKTNEWVWVQEEPENQGAWSFLLRKFKLGQLHGIYRKESSTTATGNGNVHLREQKQILEAAMAPLENQS